MPKQLKIYLTTDAYGDIPAVIDELKKLTGIVTKSQITAIALREELKRRRHQKELGDRRSGKA